MNNQIIKNIIYKNTAVDKYLNESILSELKDRVKKFFSKKSQAETTSKKLPEIKKIVIGIPVSDKIKNLLNKETPKKENTNATKKLELMNKLEELNKEINAKSNVPEYKKAYEEFYTLGNDLLKNPENPFVKTGSFKGKKIEELRARMKELEQVINPVYNLENEFMNVDYELNKLFTDEERIKMNTIFKDSRENRIDTTTHKMLEIDIEAKANKEKLEKDPQFWTQKMF